jgi:hypothetical protein
MKCLKAVSWFYSCFLLLILRLLFGHTLISIEFHRRTSLEIHQSKHGLVVPQLIVFLKDLFSGNLLRMKPPFNHQDDLES